MNKAYTDMRKEYDGLLKSGMFWEFYPTLTGQWVSDKMEWKKIYRKLKKTRNESNVGV